MNPKGTEETGDDRPAAPKPARRREVRPRLTAKRLAEIERQQFENGFARGQDARAAADFWLGMLGGLFVGGAWWLVFKVPGWLAAWFA